MILTSVVNERRMKWAWKEIPVTIQSIPGLPSSFSVLKKVRNSHLWVHFLKGFSENGLCVSDEEPRGQWAWFQMMIITNQRDISNKKTKITWFLTFLTKVVLGSWVSSNFICSLSIAFQTTKLQRTQGIHSSLVPSLLLRHSWISISEDKTFKS